MEGGWGSWVGVFLRFPLQREFALWDFQIVSTFNSRPGISQAPPVLRLRVTGESDLAIFAQFRLYS